MPAAKALPSMAEEAIARIARPFTASRFLGAIDLSSRPFSGRWLGSR